MVDDEAQIIEQLELKSKCINSLDDKWIGEWALLVEKHYRNEARSSIRLKTIALVAHIFNKYHVICEDELMSKIILPNFGDADLETNDQASLVIRKPIVHLLSDIASACFSYKYCNAVLAIIRKILNKPYRTKRQRSSDEQTGGSQTEGHQNGQQGNLQQQPQHVYAIGNVDIIDSRLIISNLHKLFRTKLYRLPIDPAVNMLDISVNYLHLTYKCPLQEPTPAEVPMIRRELFSLFLDLRCNKYGHIGLVSHNQPDHDIIYSPFIICTKRPRQQQHPEHTGPTSTSSNTANPPETSAMCSSTLLSHHNQTNQNIFVPNSALPNCPLESRCINLDTMFGGIVDCINHETDGDVLKLVLNGLPELLANKPLVLTTTDERINQLCQALSELIRQTKSTTTTTTTTSSSTSSRQTIKLDVVKPGLKCLTSLLVYRKCLDVKNIRSMLAAFDESLKVSRQPIVPMLTTCLIELQDSPEMAKFLPVVLNRLSKFSPTTALGISMLEFLSYLIMFPKLYENFSEDEYKFIFATALPYTNPFRFSDFTTCLAFRVIAMWYLNCRPSLRCEFIEFVRKSLQSNVIQPFKENPTGAIYPQPSSPITHTPPITFSCPPAGSNPDHRKRSSSLNTENSLKAQQALLGFAGNHKSSLQVNEELIETFADLLSRYTYGQCLATAPKSRFMESLVDRSTSQTWLHGNSLVTITSSRASHGWCEVMIRRPTGNTIWFGRLLNTSGSTPTLSQQFYLDSLNFGNDIISLFSTAAQPASDLANIGDESPETQRGPSLSSPVGQISTSGSSSATLSLSSIATTTATSAAASAVSNLSSAISNVSSAGLSVGVAAAGAAAAAAAGSAATTCASNNSVANFNMAANLANCSLSHLRDPRLLPKDDKLEVSLRNFDHISPYETHKIGVIYVAKGQADDRAAILANRCGSVRYYELLAHIGSCIVLEDIDPEIYFIGGLDTKGSDGKHAYFWKDNVTQVIFHVASLMPHRSSDPNCNNKNRHIGNDHVCIVYNDSRTRFRLSTIKGTGQFIMACIVITPLEGVTNLVEVELLPDLRNILGEVEPRVLSDLGAAIYARQLAIHLNLASKIHERRQCEGFVNREPYVSNWVERLRCIKRIRQRLEDGKRSTSASNTLARNSNPLK